LLVARAFDPQRIEDYMRQRIAQASGNGWLTIAGTTASWAQWEFEDYRP
jgi:hypothetical protein